MRPGTKDDSLNYIQSLTAVETPHLESVRRAAEATGKGGMQISPVEGAMLAWMLRRQQVGTLIEVGAFVGYSTLWMAAALPAGGHIHTLEHNPEHAALARRHFASSEYGDAVTLYEGDARESLEGLATDAPYDAIFIDADKGGYPHYLDWAEQHIRRGGLIIVDNVFLFGSVWQEAAPKGVSKNSWRAMRAVNERLADTSRYDAMMLPTIEGLTFAIKKF